MILPWRCAARIDHRLVCVLCPPPGHHSQPKRITLAINLLAITSSRHGGRWHWGVVQDKQPTGDRQAATETRRPRARVHAREATSQMCTVSIAPLYSPFHWSPSNARQPGGSPGTLPAGARAVSLAMAYPGTRSKPYPLTFLTRTTKCCQSVI